jgi:hypothetical protein
MGAAAMPDGMGNVQYRRGGPNCDVEVSIGEYFPGVTIMDIRIERCSATPSKRYGMASGRNVYLFCYG